MFVVFSLAVIDWFLWFSFGKQQSQKFGNFQMIFTNFTFVVLNWIIFESIICFWKLLSFLYFFLSFLHGKAIFRWPSTSIHKDFEGKPHKEWLCEQGVLKMEMNTLCCGLRDLTILLHSRKTWRTTSGLRFKQFYRLFFGYFTVIWTIFENFLS